MHTRNYQKRPLSPKLNTVLVCMWQSLAYTNGSCYYFRLNTKIVAILLGRMLFFSHEEINTVFLVEYLYEGIERRHQYVRHLYLYRNQTHG